MALDFPNSPIVGQVFPVAPIVGIPTYTWDGEKWVTVAGASVGLTGAVRYDTPQTLTSPQLIQARQNIYAAPFDAMAYSGMQINGSIDVSQENGTSGIVITNTGKNVVDGFGVAMIGSIGSMTASQISTPAVPGFINALALNCTTANPLSGVTDQISVYQYIEGYRISRLGFGYANAQPVTVGFWIYPDTVTGIMTVALKNGPANRSYIVEVPVTAGVWQYKTVTIPGDVTGAWNTTNGYGLTLSLVFGAGVNYKSAPNQWLAGNVISTAASTNFFATPRTIYLTGITVLPGNQAPTAAQSPLIMRPYDQELLLCKRYWQRTYVHNRFPAPGISSHDVTGVFALPFRVAPAALTLTAGNRSNISSAIVDSQTLDGTFRHTIASAAVGDCYALNDMVIGDARL